MQSRLHSLLDFPDQLIGGRGIRRTFTVIFMCLAYVMENGVPGMGVPTTAASFGLFDILLKFNLYTTMLKYLISHIEGADEKEIGIKQVEETLHHIIYYFNMRDQILEHCSV